MHSSFTFVDRLQRQEFTVIRCYSCDLLSPLETACIPLKINYYMHSSFTFVDRLQLQVGTGEIAYSCDLLSVLLHLWIDYSKDSSLSLSSAVVICFQFFYICG